MRSDTLDFGRIGFATGLGDTVDASERYRLLRLLRQRVDAEDGPEVRKDTAAFLAGVSAGREARGLFPPEDRAPTDEFDHEKFDALISDFVDRQMSLAMDHVNDALVRIKIQL